MHSACLQLFAKTYAAAAAQYSDAHFYEILGDESKATRAMMIENKVSPRGAQPRRESAPQSVECWLRN